MSTNLKDEIIKLLNYVEESDRTILLIALDNDDYNLARVITEGILYDIRSKFEEELSKTDNFNHIMTNILPLYKIAIKLDNLVTTLNEEF